MVNDRERSRREVSRRSLLATIGAGLSLPTAGCIDRVQSTVNGTVDDQLSITITTVPADDDRETVRIARVLEENLEKVGVDVSFDMRSQSESLRAILIDHDFDLYVGRHPGGRDPDFLYGALHSQYRSEIGWQNPFGFASLTFDQYLEAQRNLEGERRREAVGEMLEQLAVAQPFTTVCVPDEHRLAREDRFTGWENGHLADRTGYLDLEVLDEEQLHVSITDSRPTQNLNPLAPEHHERERITELLYGSLAAEVDGDVQPWLAESLEWDADASTWTVTLREDLRFHDLEELTVSDVAFTYRLLEDTTLGWGNVAVPAPRYRGRTSVVDRVRIRDDRTIELSVSTGREAGKGALTVPILPAHVWRPRAISGRDDDTDPRTNGVIETANVPPIGSGPYVFESRSERDSLTLERFDEAFTREHFEEEYAHFTLRDDVSLPEPTVEEIQFVNDPGSRSAVERVRSGSADVTASSLETHTIGGMPDFDGVTRLESPSRTFYHVGFDNRTFPFSNTHCRRLVARLLDNEWITREVFHGHAEPTATPVTGEWVPDGLEWDGGDPEVPFFGDDGDLDVEAAKAAFERAGFRYDEEGRLLVTG